MAKKFEDLRAKMSPERRAKNKLKTAQLSKELPLHQLRRALQLTQAQLAEQLGVSQASISKIEGQSDMMIGTLQRIIQAMGGELDLRVHFPQGDVSLKDLGRAA